MGDDLAKMGAARVRLGLFQGTECIEKRAVSTVEFHFYRHVAPAFRASGIAVPELLASDDVTRTLTLEYIPHSLTQPELAERHDVVSTISRIHQHPINPGWTVKRHAWFSQNTESALEQLKLSAESAAIFREVEKLSGCLFSPETLISGDTNAGNWGVREQGDVVLYDWERFSTGSPAIDLAPLIKGMGDTADFIHIANRYQSISPFPETTALAQKIAICKLWVVTEVIDILSRNNKPDLNNYLDWYRCNLPAWLQVLIRFLA